MSFWACLAPLAVGAQLVASCTSVTMGAAEWQARAKQIGQVDSADGEASSPRGLADPLYPGDVAIFKVVNLENDQTLESWELRIHAPLNSTTTAGNWRVRSNDPEMPPDILAPLLVGQVEVRSEGGETTIDSAHMALGILRQGIARSAEALAAMQAGGESQPRQEDSTMSQAVLVSLQHMAMGSSGLLDLVMNCVQPPRWWRMLSLNVEVTAVMHLKQAERVVTPYGDGWTIPIKVLINGDVGLYGEITATDAVGVLQMTGGVVDFRGFPPDRPDRSVHVQFSGPEHRLEAGESGRKHGLETGYFLDNTNHEGTR